MRRVKEEIDKILSILADKEVVKDEEEKEVVELPNYKKMVLSKPSNRKGTVIAIFLRLFHEMPI